MEPTSGVPLFFLAWFGSGIAIVSAWGAWKLYRQEPSVLRRLPSALCALVFVSCLAIVSWSIWKFAHLPNLENVGKVWLPVAAVTIRLQDSDRTRFIDELTTFAKERGAEIKNSPRSDQTRVDFQIVLAPESYLKIYNHDTTRHFIVAAYSHDTPDVWLPDWNVIVEKLTTRFGKDQVKVIKPPPDVYR